MHRRQIFQLAVSLSCAALIACSNDQPDAAQPDAAQPDAAQPDAAQQGSEATPQIQDRGSETHAWQAALPREAWAAFERIETHQDWFEVYRIRDHIYAIYEPGQFEEVISFLIIGRSNALLFDTGLGIGPMRELAEGLTAKPITVLNSHGHYDHTGGNHEFATILATEHPYSRRRAGGTAQEEVAEFVSPAWIGKPTPPGFDAQRYSIRPWEVSQYIGDSEFIDLGGVSLELISCPGHAPDSICLLDQHHRLMFTGDTFYLAPLYAHLEGSSLPAYRASAARLAARSDEVDFLLTSHNVPTAPAHYLKSLENALTAIADGTAEYQRVDGDREYQFEGFSVLTADPP
jgi:glyoxylase-like metal-dependent hydrolase (beta-lactamase superfamily II)